VKEHTATSLVRERFQSSTVVMVTWVLTCAEVRQNVHPKGCILFYVSYTSIELIFKKMQILFLAQHIFSKYSPSSTAAPPTESHLGLVSTVSETVSTT